ncbi:alpha/beta hydrolase family esterase [Cohnella fermenti]|uniref:Poly(3-hydroxybutyrate) depolymerase n=1 Tax=Cohnella fermenti TaxID=2565925 RepID=A0A4S4C896_9BACL|nr:hypothetical protein [Cohnella fermenti]THF84184.1 hypothetical protein E6C55_02490 [Cohnella fermenti]
MKGQIVILPGMPNDENRDYLPEAIRGSDMIVNENGNNSQVYPSGLKEHRGQLADGVEDVWYEYVPKSYDGSRPVPLVLSMHGGLMTGWGQAVYTSWTLVADREGFIVVFPSAGKRRFWTIECEKEKLAEATAPRDDDIYINVPPERPEDNHDMNFVLALMDRMKQQYAIDEGRVYIQGMSMGNLMTSQMVRYYGHLFAGKAGSGGPSSPGLLFDESDELINRGGPVAVWQSRLEHDVVPPHFKGDTDTVVRRNREYWSRINGCLPIPEIKIEGEDNLAFYKGERGDMVFRDVKNRDHGQTFDDAELVWDYLFSGTRRDADGRIVHEESLLPRRGDEFNIAVAAGSDKAFVRNSVVPMGKPAFVHRKLKYHGLNGDTIVRGEYVLVPVSFAASVFGAECRSSADGWTAELSFPDGRAVQFARGSIGCVVDNRVRAMLCEAVLADGELHVSIEWLCRSLFNHHATSCEGVLYMTDHPAELSKNMAHLIRDEILFA